MAYVIDKEKERLEILRRYRLIFKSFKVEYTAEDQQNIRKAFMIAVKAHEDMRRKAGEPYIYHPLEVARICAQEIGLGATSVICALLHDVVEDTPYTIDDVEANFGHRVAYIIDGLTKIDGIFEQGTLSLQAENFKKMLLTLSDDVRVILIKLADRLHNMRTLDAMPKHKQLKIASETSYLYAPLANRLGLYSIKSELEDLSMKYLEPDIYLEISEKIIKTEPERSKFIENFIAPIRQKLQEKGFDFTITARIKSAYSIWNKMKKKGIPFEEVYDLFAVRIILDTPLEKEKSDCWQVYSIVTDFYRPNPDRLRDWISTPKSNGYETLHTTVISGDGKWVEVQIRTKRMNEIAEKGYAAHWKYKAEGNINEQETGLDEWLMKIRDIIENAKNNNALDFLTDFKLTLFNEEIFVYTPKGEMKTLPVGATVLDFAYNIHTELGNTVIGGKVNHKLVPLNYKLSSGDRVEIITSKKQAPTEEWLAFANTARAKSHIKQYFKEEKRKFYDQGKSMLKDMLKNLDLEFSNDLVDQIKPILEYQHRLDLYYDIAKGKITEKDIKGCFPKEKQEGWFRRNIFTFRKRSDQQDLSLREAIQMQIKDKPETLMLDDDNIKNLTYKTSPCCNPLPGDDVIGLVMPKEGIVVHRTNCPRAIKLMSRYGNDIIKAKWNTSQEVTFLSGIKITGIDRKGLLLDVARIIVEATDLNIRSINIEGSEGMFEGTIMLYISDTEKLNQLMDTIRRIKGINSVMRMN